MYKHLPHKLVTHYPISKPLQSSAYNTTPDCNHSIPNYTSLIRTPQHPNTQTNLDNTTITHGEAPTPKTDNSPTQETSLYYCSQNSDTATQPIPTYTKTNTQTNKIKFIKYSLTGETSGMDIRLRSVKHGIKLHPPLEGV